MTIRIVSLLLFAFSASVAQAADVVLVDGVDGCRLTRAEILQGLMSEKPETRSRYEADPNLLLKFIDDMYKRRAFVCEAERLKLQDQERVYARLERARWDILISEVLQNFNDGVEFPDFEASAREQYDAYPERYRNREQIRVRHILLRAGSPELAEKRMEEAQSLLTALDGGANFEELAMQRSEDQATAHRGGVMPSFGRGVTDPDFEAAAFALTQPGQRSAVVTSRFGLHIIELVERDPERRMPFSVVREGIIGKAKAEYLAKQSEVYRNGIIDPTKTTPHTDEILKLVTDITGQVPATAGSQPGVANGAATASGDAPR